jgi:isopentenyldiphosphate isomerase
MKEKRELYDINRNPSGVIIYKGESIPEDLYEMTVSIFIENSDGELLIQKRSEDKGGKWATTGGHPKAGESCLEGIVNEVYEEMGINLDYKNIELIEETTFKNKMGCLYFIKQDININDCILQEEEVSHVKWASVDEIFNMIQNNEFHKSHCLLFKSYLNYINQNVKKVI